MPENVKRINRRSVRAGDTLVGGSRAVNSTCAPGRSWHLGSGLFHHGNHGVEQLDPNNPQRYQTSLPVPNRFNYSQSSGYMTNVIPVLVIIPRRAAEVALARSACFGSHQVTGLLPWGLTLIKGKADREIDANRSLSSGRTIQGEQVKD